MSTVGGGDYIMRLIWTQIKNFRSIKDSGRIYFNPNLTILAGKNESG